MSIWNIEPPRADEAADIARLFVASDIAEHGFSDATETDVRSIWTWPHFDRERDAWVARDRAGVAGYAWVHGPLGPARYLFARLVTRPGLSTAEVGGDLLDRIEGRALERAGGRADGASLALPCASTNAAKRELLARRGFAPVRLNFDMERELTGEIPAPQWPEGIVLTPVRRPDDDREVHETLQDAFSEHYRFFPETQEEWTRRNLDRDDFVPEISYVLRHAGQPVAAVINYASGWSGSHRVRGSGSGSRDR